MEGFLDPLIQRHSCALSFRFLLDVFKHPVFYTYIVYIHVYTLVMDPCFTGPMVMSTYGRKFFKVQFFCITRTFFSVELVWYSTAIQKYRFVWAVLHWTLAKIWTSENSPLYKVFMDWYNGLHFVGFFFLDHNKGTLTISVQKDGHSFLQL